jgi:hypothetical protein
MWGLWWTKRHWGRFFPSISVSPTNHHSTNFSIIIITRGWHNKAIGSRSAERSQLTPTPTLPIKKTYCYEYIYCQSCITDSGSPKNLVAFLDSNIHFHNHANYILSHCIKSLTHRQSFTPRKIPGTHFC